MNQKWWSVYRNRRWDPFIVYYVSAFLWNEYIHQLFLGEDPISLPLENEISKCPSHDKHNASDFYS